MVRSDNASLGWISPSRRLNDTLQRADQLAREQNHRELTLEHVILALADDTDAARVLEANGVHVARLRDYVARYIAAMDQRWPPGEAGAPVPDVMVNRIFDVASAAAESSGRSEMDGALIVAAIIGEGTSNAAAMLAQHGLDVDEDAGPPTEAMQTPNDASGRNAAFPAERRQDLSDIHRMLAEPFAPPAPQDPHLPSEKSVGPPMATPTSANVPNGNGNAPPAMPSEGRPDQHTAAMPLLQRTRPKAKPPKEITPLTTTVQPFNARAQTTHADFSTQQLEAAGTNGYHPNGDMPATGDVAPSPVSLEQIGHAQQRAMHAAHAQPVPAQPNPANGIVPPVPPKDTPLATTEVDTTSLPEADEEQRSEGEVDTPPPVEGFTQIDANVLGEMLPAKMRVGESEVVEIRVLNSDIDALTGQFEGRDVAHAGARLVSRSLSLRLRSPSGGFVIEPRTPEVQWIDVDAVFLGEEATSWRWQITGHRRGEARLQLLASARTVTSDGTVLETAMPDQVAIVRIKRGMGAIFKRTLTLATLFLAGAAAGVAARPVYRFLEPLLF